jgi:hypothetical protein
MKNFRRLTLFLSKDPWLYSLDWTIKDVKLTKKGDKLENKSIDFNKDEATDRAEFFQMVPAEIDENENVFFKTADTALRKKV